MADRRVSVGVDADVSPFVRGMATASAAARTFASNLDGTETRLSGIVQTAMALTPALVPIGAVGVPAVAGLAAQLGAAAGAAGVAALAFSGVGDALQAVNAYALSPTDANLAKMQTALRELGPAGADFVKFLYDLKPQLDELQNIAREGMFPGVKEGIEEILELGPEMQSFVDTVSRTLGDLASEAGDNLNDPRWREFFDYIEREARPTLVSMGRTFGNFVEGIANMLMAFDPLADDFNGWLLDVSRSFRDWSDNLANTQGFQDFVAYVREAGPQVGETFGAIVGALARIVEAAAPVGNLVLPVIEALADALAAVAGSPAGPVLVGAAAALGTLSRAVAIYNAANGSALVGMLGKASTEGGRAGRALSATAKGAAGLGAALLLAKPALDWFNSELNFDRTADDLDNLIRSTEDLGGPGLSGRIRSLTDELQRQQQIVDDAAISWEIFGIGFFSNDQADDAADAIERINGRLAELRREQELARGPRGVAQLFTRPQAAMAGAYADAVGVTADALDEAAMAAGDFAASLDRFNARLDKRAALRAYREAIRSFAETLEGAPGKLRKGTEAYDLVEESLDKIATSSLTAASHLRGMNRIKFLDRARDDFIGAARDMGLTRREAEKLADKLGLLDRKDPKVKVDEEGAGKTGKAIDGVQGKADKLDKSKPTPRLDADDKASPKINDAQREVNIFDGMNAWANLFVDNDQAMSAMQSARSYLDSLRGDAATMHVRVLRTGIKATQADGGIMSFYADGGVREDHVAQIAPAGTWRVWAEPETGGEAYIPLAATKRPRSLEIWRQTGQLLGAKFVEFADGAIARQAETEARVAMAVAGSQAAQVIEVPVGGGGPATFHLYDVNGQLMGTMRGVAAEAVSGGTAHAATISRMR